MYFIGKTPSIGGRNRSDYSNQVLGKILSYTMPTKDPPDPIISSTAKSHTRKILLLLGLMYDSNKISSVPNIDISGESMLNTKLRKARGKDGKMKICKWSDFELKHVKYV